MKPDSNIEEALERFALADEAEREERTEQLDDLRFRALQQWPDKLKRLRESDINGARPCLVLDQVGQRCRRVINDSRHNLPSIRVRPVDDRSDKDTAEVINGLIRHVEDVSTASMAYLTALAWAVDVGLGYFRILTEYTSDDSWDQQIRIARIHNRFAVYRDPYSTSLDGSDFEWAFITDDVPRKALKKAHPKAEIPSDFPAGSEGDRVRSWFGEETVRVAEYFRIVRERDEVVLLEDQSSMYGSRYKELLSEGGELLPVIRSRPVDRKVCQWQKIIGSEVLEESEFPSSYIPIIPVIGTEFWIDGKRELSGLVRPAKDPQRGFNYHGSIATEQMALQPRAPYIGAAGQFEGHPEWDTANSENYSKLEYEPVSSGGILVPQPQRQQMSGAPTGSLQMMQMFAENISMATGMHEASIGAPSNETSRVAIEARNQKGDIGTSHYRGNLAFSMTHAARILLEMFPRVMDTAQIARIIGEDGAADTVSLDPDLPGPSQKTPKGQPNIHNITIGRYDLTADIGPAFATRRQDAAAAMIEMARVDEALMATAGDLVYREMDWPGADKIADRRKKGLPPEFQDDEEGGEPQIPPQLKAQIQQGMDNYEQQLEQAQQMIQALQEQLGQASAAAQEGQAAVKDKSMEHDIKSMEHDIKWQELQLKDFEARTKRQELELKAEEIRSRIEQIQAQTAQTQAGTLEVESVNQTLAGLIQAQQGMEAALSELSQIRAEQLAAEAGALLAMQAPKSIQLVRDEQDRPVGFSVHQEGQPPRQGTLVRDQSGRLAGAE